MIFRLLIVALVLVLAAWATEPVSDALCDTDSDCMRLCPADDAECDGGPQGSR